MTNAMIERIANAIMTELDRQADGPQNHSPWVWTREDDIVQIDGNVSLSGIARAAIEAMREPTDAMRQVVDEADDGEWGRSLIWPEMINAALKDI